MARFGYLLLFFLLIDLIGYRNVEGLGMNWGTMASHKLPPKVVVQMLKDNNISKVKLFDADEDTMKGLAGSDIEVMIAIPNGQLQDMTDYDTAKAWVKKNVTRYNFKGGVNVKYVAVGNEPFLKSYNGSFLNSTFPALQNIQNALNDAGFGDNVKATVPLNADVYESPANASFPSAGKFRSDISGVMSDIVHFLSKNNAPFTVNIYPFLSLQQSPDFPIDYAFFDGASKPVVDTNGIAYTNVFDANFDTLVSSLKDVGVGDIPIVVGEVGWPTDGDKNANFLLAQRFYNGLLKKLGSNQGTPLRPKQYLEVYLFGLLDEDTKSVAPGDFERHWGIFTYDGQPKYPMDLTGQGLNSSLVGAKDVKYLPVKWCVLNPNASNQTALTDNINYACTYADCTKLGFGSSCNGLDAQGNASYAFNIYYQTQSQKDESCSFQGMAMVTTNNASQANCNFTIQIATSSARTHRVWPSSPYHIGPPLLLLLAFELVVSFLF
ncbi:Glucan endo-1,3-beta-glucosidase [Thalictrum thalictroides]|uniref:glucan endo-1,3-beta-D-glucosidase n=1 Tax=Thalictrum thalictroides TaxID=46969 RepID=A0A7J6V292_THATH|nr:Glucan endo-1,3-beta-glucosidase [Thalictrum thalictroides]